MHRAALRFWLLGWISLFGLYLLFAAKLSWAEVIVGMGAGLAGTLVVRLCVRAANAHYQARIQWLPLLARLPLRVLADCGIVGLVLLRRITSAQAVEGVFRTIPFDVGGDDPASAARRALVTAGISISPNTYLVAIDRKSGLALVHQLVASTQALGKGDREWPF